MEGSIEEYTVGKTDMLIWMINTFLSSSGLQSKVVITNVILNMYLWPQCHAAVYSGVNDYTIGTATFHMSGRCKIFTELLKQ